MVNHEVWKAFDVGEVPNGDTILDMGIEKEANGKIIFRVTARGYEKMSGSQFNPHDMEIPVVSETTVSCLQTISMI